MYRFGSSISSSEISLKSTDEAKLSFIVVPLEKFCDKLLDGSEVVSGDIEGVVKICVEKTDEDRIGE